MKNKSYRLKEDVLIIYRDLNELDLFLKEFLDIIKKYSDYLVVSGYVSISTGRTRGTEDIDVLVPVMNKESFNGLFNTLIKNKFWCYQGDDSEKIYDYIKNLTNIRFAKENQLYPNIECVPINESKKAKYFEFTHPQKIMIQNSEIFKFKIPPLEFEILYKEIILAGKKDVEDAKHLRTIFSDVLNEKKFKEYEPIIRGELR